MYEISNATMTMIMESLEYTMTYAAPMLAAVAREAYNELKAKQDEHFSKA